MLHHLPTHAGLSTDQKHEQHCDDELHMDELKMAHQSNAERCADHVYIVKYHKLAQYQSQPLHSIQGMRIHWTLYKELHTAAPLT